MGYEDLVHAEELDGATVLRMSRGKANALDLELLQALGQRLDRLAEQGSGPVVLSGAGRMFSAGVDLFRVVQEGEAYLQQFLPQLTSALRRMLEFPQPLVAAINGHALAGGCILAMACDQRLLVQEGAKLGVTELSVGVPFPALALEVFRRDLPDGLARQLVLRGKVFGPQEALDWGVVDELAPAEELMARALDRAARLGRIPAAAFALTKHQLNSPVLMRVDGPLAELDAKVLANWCQPETLAQMRAFLDKNVGKG